MREAETARMHDIASRDNLTGVELILMTFPGDRAEYGLGEAFSQEVSWSSEAHPVEPKLQRHPEMTKRKENSQGYLDPRTHEETARDLDPRTHEETARDRDPRTVPNRRETKEVTKQESEVCRCSRR